MCLYVSVIVQSYCHIVQFSHKILHVSTLLLDDTLLKFVVTEVVFNRYFKTLILTR